MSPEIPSEPEIRDRYFDRELSWIDFNARVLAEAMDPANPVLERLKFTGIVSSNFEEFFMVRVASLNETDSLMKEIYKKAFGLMDLQNESFRNALAPELEKAGIVRVRPQALTDKQSEYLRNLYQKEILPLLTPVALRSAQAIPFLVNLSMYRIVELVEHTVPASKYYAVIEVPKNYTRMISLPSEQRYSYILLEDVIALFAKDLFPGYEIVQHGIFRLTRAAEMSLDEEKDEDFAKIMSEALRTRRTSSIVRMVVHASDEIIEFLKPALGVPDYKVYRTGEWIDFKGLSQLAFLPMFEDLRSPPWNPLPVQDFEEADEVWSVIRERDILVHHPYQSFDCFLRFLDAASRDPDVIVIKQTLYRAAEPSAVIACLERAAESGKQVTVLVELKARFDEQRNIEWAKRLRNAGATVIYGVAGLKTHAKACLVVRREVEGIRRYAHLSTGNYNEKTARLYTDLGFFTAKDEMTGDVASFFNVITGYSHPMGFTKIEIAPYRLRQRLERLVIREAMRSKKDRPGLIIAKMNSLVDEKMIEALYRASQAGVRIRLNVRGICRLRPGIKGLSENIEVTSIVDMFLEHSRVFYFFNDGEEEVYLASADWMQRNFDRRLEVMFPVEDAKLKRRVIELLGLYFKDNTKSWRLLADGRYEKQSPGAEKPFRVQEYLCRKFLEYTDKKRQNPAWKELKPQKPKID